MNEALSAGSYFVIIPARLDSTRLPRKMLADLAGKPLIQRTYENALKLGAEQVVIATDALEIAEAAQSFGAPVCMTKRTHQNGTERLSEAVHILGLAPEAVVLNVQGDEPFLPLAMANATVNALLEHPNTGVATGVLRLSNQSDIFDPSVVKVLRNRAGLAHYFSRAPVPWNRDQRTPNEAVEAGFYHRHVGLYAYRVSSLRAYCALSPAPWEVLESLEQLRWLWHGYSIVAALLEMDLPKGIDTAEDLQVAQTYFSGMAE